MRPPTTANVRSGASHTLAHAHTLSVSNFTALRGAGAVSETPTCVHLCGVTALHGAVTRRAPPLARAGQVHMAHSGAGRTRWGLARRTHALAAVADV